MAQNVQMPDIGGDEVNLVSLNIKVGDVIKADQEIAMVEGDKASMEIPAPVGGKVVEVFVKVGDKVTTGTNFYAVEAEGTAISPVDPKEEGSVTTASTASATPLASAVEVINLPDIGGDEVSVVSIKVKVGDTVKADQELLTVEGDKASMDVPAPKAGKVVKILIKEGDKVVTGTPAFKFEVEGAAPATAPTPVATQEVPKAAPASAPVATQSAETGLPQSVVESSTKFAHATPNVRRTAREYGVNLDKVSATGPKGRVLPVDVLNYIKNAVQLLQSGKSSPGTGLGLDLLPWPKVDFAKFGEVEVNEMGRIPKISGQNLARNWVMIPHVTQFDWADITDLEAFRKQQNDLAAKRKLDVKITPLVFIMKAVAKALEQFPKFNSSLSADASIMTIKKYINIGIAVDTPNGLVVPVIRDVNKKGIIELSRELAEISAKARNGKLTGADMSGGCFTISSLGGIGTTGFTPIVNAPEVGILGVSKSETRAVWDGKQFTPRLMLPLCLSFDHRAIDGADGARFITAVNQALSDLRTLIM